MILEPSNQKQIQISFIFSTNRKNQKMLQDQERNLIFSVSE